jgi:hypothetical protein
MADMRDAVDRTVTSPTPEDRLSAPARPVTRRPRDPRPNRRRPSGLGYVAVILLLFLAGVGVIGAIATVAAYNVLAADLDDPARLTEYVLPRRPSSTTGPARRSSPGSGISSARS